jgi:hypothetical protein
MDAIIERCCSTRRRLRQQFGPTGILGVFRNQRLEKHLNEVLHAPLECVAPTKQVWQVVKRIGDFFAGRAVARSSRRPDGNHPAIEKLQATVELVVG